jgi:hypothetical protein
MLWPEICDSLVFVQIFISLSYSKNGVMHIGVVDKCGQVIIEFDL